MKRAAKRAGVALLAAFSACQTSPENPRPREQSASKVAPREPGLGRSERPLGAQTFERPPAPLAPSLTKIPARRPPVPPVLPPPVPPVLPPPVPPVLPPPVPPVLPPPVPPVLPPSTPSVLPPPTPPVLPPPAPVTQPPPAPIALPQESPSTASERAPAEAEQDPKAPSSVAEDPRLQILRGLVAQKERRLAGVLRELAAAKSTSRSESLVGARAMEELTRSKRRVRELERELAKARAGLPSIAAKPSAGLERATDPRFASGGLLDPTRVVARVDGEALTLGELLVKLHFNYSVDYLESFMRVKIIEQEAARQKIVISEGEQLVWAARQLAHLSQQSGGDEAFRAKLAKQQKSFGNYEAALRYGARYALQVERLVTMRRQTEAGLARIEVLARRLYDERYGPEIKGAHIFWRHQASDDEGAWQRSWRKAEASLASLRSGQARFSELAEKLSEDEETRYKGGRFGPIGRDRYKDVPTFNAAIFRLAPGQMQLVRSKEGIHLVKVTERVPPPLSWPQARSKLSRELANKGPTREEIDSLLDTLQARAKRERLLRLR